MRMERWTAGKGALALGATLAALWASAAGAVNINFVSGATGIDQQVMQELVKPWEEETGNTVTFVPMPSSTTDQFAQYKLWLAAGNADVDVYMADVIWAPQLSDQFLDLTEAAAEVIPDHFPSIIESQTVDGKLVAMPFFTDAPALYYRKDLLEKYGEEVPTTWEELTATAQKIQDGERGEGTTDLWGYVWQGAAYEGLTCNALEWVKSNGGGQIIEPDGTISIYNENAVKALEMAKGWVGTISPPGVLSYMEEESRGVWQTGNAVFMRNWPYAYATRQRRRQPDQGQVRRGAAAVGRRRQHVGGDARRLEPRGLELFAEPRSGDRAGDVHGLGRVPEADRDQDLAPADDHVALRRRGDRRGAAADPALEGHLPERGAAAVGADQGRLQRGLVEVLDGGARHAVAGPALPLRTSRSSSSTSRR